MSYNRATSALRLARKFRGREGPFLVPLRKPEELRLLVDWNNPLRIFASNLADWLCGRVIPDCVTTSAPDHFFWRNTELRTVWPRRGMLDSALAHTALLGLLYAVSIWPDAAVHLASPQPSRSSVSINAYTLSQYLPELHGPLTHPKVRRVPDPVQAEQEIFSLPDAPDNLRQTIVAPPTARLQQEINLPNIVVFRPTPPVQPLAASEHTPIISRLPELTPNVAGPAADTSSLYSQSRALSLQPQVVAPAPDLTEVAPLLTLPFSKPALAEPAPDVGHLNQSGAATPLARLAPGVPNPVPGAPQVAGILRAPAQFIALNLHPADVRAPVELPAGNRRGEFAGSRTGKPNASGSPSSDPALSTLPYNAPPGVSVSTPAAPRVATPTSSAPVSGGTNVVALASAPAPSIPTRQPIAGESAGRRSELENRIFAGRRSYTLSVNMPNLNAATGSWVIHFAERHPASGQNPIAAPEVLSKFDPAYPGELMQDGVQGVVILTAIIRADGSVGNIAVAQSLNPLLDRNAVEAFSRWLFRPAMRNGQTIDLEAVITVPFHAKTTGF